MAAITPTRPGAPGATRPQPPPTPPASRGGPKVLASWLVAVLVVVAVAVAARLYTAPFPEGPGLWLIARLDEIYVWVVSNRNSSPLFIYGFNHVSLGLGAAVDAVANLLALLTWPGVILLGSFLSWRAAGWRGLAMVLATFAVFGFTGLWDEAMVTLSLIIVSVLLALAIGIPLGIAAGRSDRFHSAINPVLNFLQIMPAFAYLMPMLLLFGTGNPSAAVATVIYAFPPAVRITALAIRGVDRGAVEAAESLGSTSWQLLAKVRLPLAKRTIMLGVNQTIMLAVSMVVIGSVIGAGGLGDAIYQALAKVNVGEAFTAGLAIVMLAIAMDRVTAAVGHGEHTPVLTGWTRWLLPAGAVAAAAGAAAAATATGWDRWPTEWRIRIARPVNQLNDGLNSLIGSVTRDLADWLLTYVINPLTAVLGGTPWWLVVLAAAVLGAVFAGWRAAATCGLSILTVGLLGVWDQSMDTLAQVLVATVITIALGFVVGVVMARSAIVATALRPILDAMQTLPPFVYLIPAVALFGVGRVPALAAAVVFALPPVIRLVNDGIRGVPTAAVEAAVSQGSTRWQLLTKVQLPLARSSLMLAVNQGIMMVLAMVVIGALVGGGALGYGVVFGLAQNQLGLGITSGLAIVCLGLFLDRITQGRRTGNA